MCFSINVLICLGFILGSVNPQQSGIADIDLMTKTVVEVKNDLSIENDIDVAVLKTIDKFF